MSFEEISLKKLAIIFIIAGVVLVFALMGSSVTNLFSASITEEAEVKMKQAGDCVLEPSDGIPRTISDCPYNVNDTLVITYKPQQPSIHNHEAM
jgi:hypothetical protein